MCFEKQKRDIPNDVEMEGAEENKELPKRIQLKQEKAQAEEEKVSTRYFEEDPSGPQRTDGGGENEERKPGINLTSDQFRAHL